MTHSCGCLLVEYTIVVLPTFVWKIPGGHVPPRLKDAGWCGHGVHEPVGTELFRLLLWLVIGALLGVWGSTWCLRACLCVGGCSFCGSLFAGWSCGWLVVVGVVCENCIVDASIFIFCVCVL